MGFSVSAARSALRQTGSDVGVAALLLLEGVESGGVGGGASSPHPGGQCLHPRGGRAAVQASWPDERDPSPQQLLVPPPKPPAPAADDARGTKALPLPIALPSGEQAERDRSNKVPPAEGAAGEEYDDLLATLMA